MDRFDRRSTYLSIVLLVLLAASDAVLAQKWYRVEVLVFSQLDSYATERAPTQVRLEQPEKVVDLAFTGNTNIRLLDKAQRSLNPDAYTLNSTGVYRVLFHEAWVQAGQSKHRAPWIQVRGGEYIGATRQLDGVLRIFLSSYLHLNTRLQLRRTGADSREHGGDAVIYSLEQSEVLKIGKLHYVDHPKLGLLIKVTRATAP